MRKSSRNCVVDDETHDNKVKQKEKRYRLFYEMDEKGNMTNFYGTERVLHTLSEKKYSDYKNYLYIFVLEE